MPVAVGVGLEEDSAGCILRGIGGDSEGGGEVREVKDGFREEKAFQGIEGRLTQGGPIPGEVLLGEINEGMGDIGVVRDKVLVEIGEAEEGANVLYLGRGKPTCNTVEFDRVHGYCPGLTIILRYLISSVAYLHFSSFR